MVPWNSWCSVLFPKNGRKQPSLELRSSLPALPVGGSHIDVRVKISRLVACGVAPSFFRSGQRGTEFVQLEADLTERDGPEVRDRGIKRAVGRQSQVACGFVDEVGSPSKTRSPRHSRGRAWPLIRRRGAQNHVVFENVSCRLRGVIQNAMKEVGIMRGPRRLVGSMVFSIRVRCWAVVS